MCQAVGSSAKYEYITEHDSPNFNGQANIRGIVVHHWGLEGQRFDDVVNILCSPAYQASAHYVLEDGKVACLVPPGLRAWHVLGNEYQNVMVGIYDVNANTIGIECRPECTEGDRETLAALIADIWKDYGKVPIYYHAQFMPTACAGKYIPYIENGWLAQRAESIYKGEEDEEMRPEVKAWLEALYDRCHKEEAPEWAKKELEEAKEKGITDGTRPNDFATRAEVAAMIVRAKEDK